MIRTISYFYTMILCFLLIALFIMFNMNPYHESWVLGLIVLATFFPILAFISIIVISITFLWRRTKNQQCLIFFVTMVVFSLFIRLARKDYNSFLEALQDTTFIVFLISTIISSVIYRAWFLFHFQYFSPQGLRDKYFPKNK